MATWALRRYGVEVVYSRQCRYLCAFVGWFGFGYSKLWHDGPHHALNLGPLHIGWGFD